MRAAAIQALRRLSGRLRHNESGAVTVEWVVLTAGVVAMAAGITAFLADEGQATLRDHLRTTLDGATQTLDRLDED